MLTCVFLAMTVCLLLQETAGGSNVECDFYMYLFVSRSGAVKQLAAAFAGVPTAHCDVPVAAICTCIRTQPAHCMAAATQQVANMHKHNLCVVDSRLFPYHHHQVSAGITTTAPLTPLRVPCLTLLCLLCTLQKVQPCPKR